MPSTATVTPISPPRRPAGRSRATDIDRHVSARMRERLILLGMTQAELGEALGVTYQQAHKYLNGINRISAGRLHAIAQALSVEVGYFFEGLDQPPKLSAQKRWLLEVTKGVAELRHPDHQQAVQSLVYRLRKAEEPDR